MRIHFLVWDENGLSSGDVELPAKAITATIVDGDREVTYDPENYEVIFEKAGQVVPDFADDQIALEPYQVGAKAGRQSEAPVG